MPAIRNAHLKQYWRPGSGVGQFVQWYNHEHRRSAINFATPGERHASLDTVLPSKRAEVYQAAKVRHPERRSGATRNWQPIRVVYLNSDHHSRVRSSSAFSGGLGLPLVIIDPLIGEPV